MVRLRAGHAVLPVVLLALLSLPSCAGGGGRSVDAGDGGEGDAGTGDGGDGAEGDGGAAEGPWRPEPGTDWQWQLSGTLDLDVDVPVYDVDGFETEAADVAALHARGVRVICYVNVGAWEDFRPDAGDFPRELLGGGNGWEGERWLDIRAREALRPLLERRFDMCADKGFDAIEPDLTDGYLNETGFPLTAEDQLAYNRMVAELAHERGLSVGLKNDLEQIPELVGDFDFAVNEECAELGECQRLTPFVEAGKAVLHVEYALAAEEFCAQTTELGLSSMVKHLSLDAWREPC
ncbi:endo alpha-1,4 polygalactosaminidase [Streptomyces hoynatensis]|uniref:Endo alpha-1,4 polygalactosaminidase n=1 Tax=Streptomyces hoynatensis TaxID=1141874 RepID=A0A3A9Z196_9ACTN|nr:endo alpha-1,4 polygalactosaminidase [Streptomyces hoynatensis]RKN41714.1 endo alpha-1,4 polygalactosaminidase [Streptomyces hoynatensis]